MVVLYVAEVFMRDSKKIFVLTSLFLAYLIFGGPRVPFSNGQSPAPAGALILEGLSATSVNLPESEFGPEKLFDNDPSTYWATMPGAAVDEGVLMRFAAPVYIYSIALKPSSAKKLLPIAAVQLFINGQETAVMTTENPLLIQQKVKSLYIRVTDLQGVSTTQALFSGQGQTGLSEIMLYDQNNKIIPVLSPRIVKGRVKPSSALTPKEAYQSDYLFDSRLDFGWADGNPNKTGVGEFLEFETESPVTISALKIWNGYQRSRTHFLSNERLKSFSFAGSDTSSSYSLKNSEAPQTVFLQKPLGGKQFKLSVTAVFPGSKYKDLVISELRLFDGSGWFILSSGQMEQDKKNLLQAAQKTPLGQVIDRRFYLQKANPKNPDQVSVQSLVLRSNGSFVLWKETYSEGPSGDDSEKIVADGNWQITKSDKGKSLVRIFGRLHQLKTLGSNNYNPYAGENSGPSQTETIQIFQDALEITPTSLISQKRLFLPFSF